MTNPPPEPPYYAIDDLQEEEAAVWLRCDGRWAVGKMTRKSGQRRYFLRTPSGKALELSRNQRPDAWRPIDVKEWTGGFPNPIDSYVTYDKDYSSPGSVSREEAHIRVIRALRTAGLAAITTWKPDHRDKQDEVIACRWWKSLGREDQVLLSRRSSDPPGSWREIGEHLGISQQAARLRHSKALDRIYEAANSKQKKAS